MSYIMFCEEKILKRIKIYSHQGIFFQEGFLALKVFFFMQIIIKKGGKVVQNGCKM